MVNVEKIIKTALKKKELLINKEVEKKYKKEEKIYENIKKNKENIYFKKLINVLKGQLNIKQYDNYDIKKIFKMWIYVGREGCIDRDKYNIKCKIPDISYNCACDHIIKFNYYIYNFNAKDKILVIGSCCIKKFINPDVLSSKVVNNCKKCKQDFSTRRKLNTELCNKCYIDKQLILRLYKNIFKEYPKIVDCIDFSKQMIDIEKKINRLKDKYKNEYNQDNIITDKENFIDNDMFQIDHGKYIIYKIFKENNIYRNLDYMFKEKYDIFIKGEIEIGFGKYKCLKMKDLNDYSYKNWVKNIYKDSCNDKLYFLAIYLIYFS